MDAALDVEADFPPGLGITSELWSQTPPAMRIIVLTLAQEIVLLKARITQQDKRITELESRLNKNSTNSSKPPSSDPPNVPRPKIQPSGKKRGGQPGHVGQTRMMVPTEDVDAVVRHFPQTCEHCHAATMEERLVAKPFRHQVAELPQRRVVITEHQTHDGMCMSCGKSSTATLPILISHSMFGENLQAEIAMLTGRYRLSRREVVDYVEQAWDFQISLGSISHIESCISNALEQPYHEALSSAQAAPIRNVDETGWRQHGRLAWLWSVSTSAVSVFHIHQNRSRSVFVNWMGEETLKHGTWIADRYPVYRVIAPNHLALCHAHIRRDLLRISEFPGKTGELGKRCVEIHKKMFAIIDQYRSEQHSFETFRANFRPYFEAFEREVEAGVRCDDKQGSAFFRSLQRCRVSLWTFTRVEGVEPTNNAAERSVRKGVIWRRSSLGTQSEIGSRYVERMLTIAQTCSKQGHKLLAFLQAALTARLNGTQAPLLISQVV